MEVLKKKNNLGKFFLDIRKHGRDSVLSQIGGRFFLLHARFAIG
jgi:hypothetical protein